MEAKKTITLYNDERIIAEVKKGEKYYIPKDVKVFEGTIEECKKEHPNLEPPTDLI